VFIIISKYQVQVDGCINIIQYLFCTGYQIIQDVLNEGQEDETPVITVHGHVLNGVTWYIWMEGGVLEAMGEGCYDIGMDRRTAPSLS
jgi:hypothetical protein